ncbi:hypothetical protein N9Y42_06660 [Mariniblastus sp.]|nr:hypothetical protein [Mariniblastus sp.]
MKIFKYNLASSNRHGLSVIEVLTSIVVALIGVFGVLAMIPFSVKQTQSGLDKDAATSMARSAMSNFEASGFKVTAVPRAATDGTSRLNWVGDIQDGNGVAQVPALPSTPLVCIDPLGVTQSGVGVFPFNSPTSVLTMPTVTLLNPDGSLFSVGDARRMFRLTDDLVFAESDDPAVIDSDLNGPQQIFNENLTGAAINRQSTGAVSWCAIAEPIYQNPTAGEIDSFKFNVLVFKDRITDTAPESEMAVAIVTNPTGTVASPLSSVSIGVALSADIRQNDWVMLINSTSTNTTAPLADETNVAFARVSKLYAEDPDTPGYDPANTISRLTLDGPDFNFTGTTYIVHLRNVVAVFPRTIKLESPSIWNANN